MSRVDTVRELYRSLSRGEVAALLALLTPTTVWSITAGMPLGGDYIGPEEVVSKVIERIPEVWSELAHEVEQLIDGGDEVVMVGWYRGTWKESGAPFRARVVQVLTFEGEKLARFLQVADTAVILDAAR